MVDPELKDILSRWSKQCASSHAEQLSKKDIKIGVPKTCNLQLKAKVKAIKQFTPHCPANMPVAELPPLL